MTNPLHQTEKWESEFQDHRKTALLRYRRQIKHLPHTAWVPAHGEGKNLRRTANIWDTAKLKTVYEVWDPIKEGFWPPRNVLLTDVWVYMAVKLLSPEERAYRWPGDFTPQGEIKPCRVPCGNPPLIKAHGVYCLPVFRYWYVLCGEALAAYGNWILASPRRSGGQAFTVGLVCIPPEIVPRGGPQQTLERDLFFHGMSNPWDMEKAASVDWKAAEAHRGMFDRWALRDSDWGTMLYGLDADEKTNYQLLPIKDVPGFTVRCNEEYASSSELLPRGTRAAPNMNMQSWTQVVPEVDMSALASLAQSTGGTRVSAGNGTSGQSSAQTGPNIHVSTVDRIIVDLSTQAESQSAATNPPSNSQLQSVPNTGDRVWPTELQTAVAALLEEETPSMDRVRQCMHEYAKHLQETTAKTVQEVAGDLEVFYKYLREA